MAGVTTAISSAGMGVWVTILLGTVAGVLAYIAALYGLWRAAGSPDAGEALLSRKFRIVLGRAAARVRE
jgi:hypothetical protein